MGLKHQDERLFVSRAWIDEGKCFGRLKQHGFTKVEDVRSHLGVTKTKHRESPRKHVPKMLTEIP
jgi:hypothetical protein